jgi:hypothetical protein
MNIIEIMKMTLIESVKFNNVNKFLLGENSYKEFKNHSTEDYFQNIKVELDIYIDKDSVLLN